MKKRTTAEERRDLRSKEQEEHKRKGETMKKLETIEYQKTMIFGNGKSYGANVYDVLLGDRKIGLMYKGYYPAIGLGPKYVGHTPGSYEWKFDVEEWACDCGLFKGGMYTFNTQKEMKAFLEGDRKAWEWSQ
jgi:hypothetical protein